jgi:hypothetical protein
MAHLVGLEHALHLQHQLAIATTSRLDESSTIGWRTLHCGFEDLPDPPELIRADSGKRLIHRGSFAGCDPGYGRYCSTYNS